LRNELLSIAGIASAELEGAEDAPQGVRVQLAAGADAESVGREVQRILASHGMRSHRPNEQVVADTFDDGQGATAPAQAPAAVAGFHQPGPPPPPGAEGNGGAVFRLPGVTQPEVEPHRELEPIRSGIAVRVVAGDSSVIRQVGSSSDGMDAAIVGAITELLGLESELIAVQRGEAGDALIVTVLVEVVGVGRQVGSAVITAGETFAVGQAAWQALRALD
jgi:hypothetical protein